jgi:hypothetical protein
MPIASTSATGPSFIQKLRNAVHAVKQADKEDPWMPVLR